MATKDCFLFDSWFSSKKSKISAIDVGTDTMGMVKTNTKVFCKETIEKLANYWQGGSYLVLRSNHVVPRVRPIIAIAYKYNTEGSIFYCYIQCLDHKFRYYLFI